MIKFLVDESIPLGVTNFLRGRGLDVKEVGGSGNAGASDDAIMVLARNDERILLTFDKHFANILTYPPRKKAPPLPGYCTLQRTPHDSSPYNSSQLN